MARPALSRILLGASAAILLAAAVIHASAFPSVTPTIEAAQLPPFHAGAYKALWLVDSTNLAALALLYAFVALRPAAATPGVIVISALAPLAAGILLYTYLGAFFAGHLMVATWLLASVAALFRERVTPSL